MPMPYKGLRVKITTRVPPLLAAEATRAADKAGLTLSDWTAEAIRHHLGSTDAHPA